ncbi:hypothetical protein [Rheinheimera sp. MMS21-TC3]|uniref:hypothetical protein n=1 Tax=Rheinheimera sp. MMS21-TC3 TaxID=3072790 RepID=UPI0028C43DEE|nr:hypothetical protein [Rheinheimera sp. MMS21-TC3]WNO60299.1 hypothetical protein RDV63_04875 [Rheinheimera sp. MMS21-TC3]
MRNIVLLAILLYVSLLCSIQPGHAYDSRLSPLADNPFYAVNPSPNGFNVEAITENSPDHEPILTNTYSQLIQSYTIEIADNFTNAKVQQQYTSAYARAPPIILHL